MERVIVTRTCKDCCEYPVCASRDYYVEHGPVGWVNHAYQHSQALGFLTFLIPESGVAQEY